MTGAGTRTPMDIGASTRTAAQDGGRCVESFLVCDERGNLMVELVNNNKSGERFSATAIRAPMLCRDISGDQIGSGKKAGKTQESQDKRPRISQDE